MKIVKYKIDSQIYICGTNIKASTNYIKKLYKSRWTVEEGFKTMKSNLCLKSIHSKTESLLKQEIAIRELIFVISRLIQLTIAKKEIYYSTSFKLVLDFVINYFLFSKKFLFTANNILFDCQFKNILNRKKDIKI